MPKHDERHLTTEQLSAFIDKQLSTQEQAESAAHLQGCARCQQALVGLQQTAAFLRMLPKPSLPRSFTLPAGVSHLQERPALQALPTPPRPPARQVMWQHYMRRSLRAVSGIAAVIGLIFLLSSIVISLPHGGGTPTASTGNTAAPATTQHSNIVPGSTDKAATPTIAANTKPTATIRTAPPHTPSAAPGTRPTPANSQAQPPLPLPDLATPLGQQEVGFTLFVLGVIGVLLTRRRQRDRSTS
ncbi:MAG: zf-HC2 domain-containing protein [Ktedonobacteraceae bacterium]